MSTEAESIKEPATPKKPTRTKKPTTTVGFDFTKIMEYLGGTVEVNTTDDFDKAVAEIRGLRDLQIVIARRSANLAIEIHKTSGAAVSQVAALRELLK